MTIPETWTEALNNNLKRDCSPFETNLATYASAIHVSVLENHSLALPFQFSLKSSALLSNFSKISSFLVPTIWPCDLLISYILPKNRLMLIQFLMREKTPQRVSGKWWVQLFMLLPRPGLLLKLETPLTSQTFLNFYPFIICGGNVEIILKILIIKTMS